jgi:hypothetical protein
MQAVSAHRNTLSIRRYRPDRQTHRPPLLHYYLNFMPNTKNLNLLLDRENTFPYNRNDLKRRNDFSGGEVMRKLMCVVAFFLLFSLVTACKSSPEAVSDDEVVVVEDVELLTLYHGYANIVLDGATDYTVKRGDTLTKIAREYYGKENGYYFPLIMLASKVAETDPDKIVPGEKFVIPDLSKNLNDPLARAQLKSLLFDIAHVYDGKANAANSEARKARYQKDNGGLVALARTL